MRLSYFIIVDLQWYNILILNLRVLFHQWVDTAAWLLLVQRCIILLVVSVFSPGAFGLDSFLVSLGVLAE